MSGDEDFSNAPVSIGELRSDRAGTRGSAEWTPRDALVSLLRRLDSGELAQPDCMVVCMRMRDNENFCTTESVQVGSDTDVMIGLLERVKHNIMCEEPD